MHRTTSLTKHAGRRMQQRCIPPLVVQWLIAYGATQRQSGGTEIRYFDKDARRRVERECGRIVRKRMDDFLDCYLVVSGEDVITVGRRYKKIVH